MMIVSFWWIWFGLACLAGLILPLIPTSRAGGKASLKFTWTAQNTGQVLGGGGLLLLVTALAFGLKLALAKALLFALGGFVAFCLLSAFTLAPGMAGVPLLLLAVCIAGRFEADPAQAQLPLLAYMLGLGLAGLGLPQLAGPSDAGLSQAGLASRWADFLLPAVFCVGSVWITLSSPQSAVIAYQGLLILALSIALLLRGVQALWLQAQSVWVRGTFVTVMSGLLAWLGIQNGLLQPAFLHWAWLFAGGALLGVVLGELESDAVDLKGTPQSVAVSVIQLMVLGLAVLVASRLFGSVGWLVLAAMVLVSYRHKAIVGLASLFLTGRVLLQAFIVQFNPNVTGINITHPYASAALYAGFAIMLLLPVLLKSMANASDRETSSAEVTEAARTGSLQMALLGACAILVAGLASYFLHAEATGSLLTALWVAGVSVSLLGHFPNVVSRFTPLPLAFLATLVCLMAPELIDAGNVADKTEKLWVLGGALVMFAALTAFIPKAISPKSGSGSQPVSIA